MQHEERQMPKRNPQVTVKYKNKVYSGNELAAARKNGIISTQEASRNTLVYANGKHAGSPTELQGEELEVAIETETVITRGAFNFRKADHEKTIIVPKKKISPAVSIRYKNKIYYGDDLKVAIENKKIPKDKIYLSTLVQAKGENAGQPTQLQGEELKLLGDRIRLLPGLHTKKDSDQLN